MPLSLKDLAPFRLLIDDEDMTFLLADSWTFSSKDPGGYEAASFSVPRDVPGVLRGAPVLLTSGLSTAWEGRVSQIQRSLGNRTSIVCEGYSSLLADNTGSMVFIDRDLTRWGAPSVTRQAALIAVGLQLGSTQVAADPSSNAPALVQTIQDSWVSPYQPICETVYDAGPENALGAMYAELSGAGVIGQGGNWLQAGGFASDSTLTTSVESGNDNAGGPLTFGSGGNAWRFAFLQHRYTANPGGSQGATYNVYWSNLAVYGNHGMAQRGASPGGYYPSDIAGWVVAQVPGLQMGVTQATDETGFILPHSVYYTPVTLDTMMADMATAAGWHWGVWESQASLTGDPRPRVDFRPRPALGQFTAFCERRDTTACDVREDLSQQFNKCVVTYTDAAGTAGAVTVTMDNPILDQAGIASRTLPISAGTMDAPTAALYGQEALAFTYQSARVAGSIQIDQPIDTGGGPGPAWLLKPGIDRIRIGDLPSTDAFGTYNDLPISRMEFSGSSAGFSTSLEVGSGANLVETLNARIQSATFLAGQGG